MGARTERAWLAWLACERRTETSRNVHSALWHRGATVRARVLAVIPSGLTPLLNRGCRSLPLPMSFGGYSARCLRAPAVKRGRKSEALTASAPVAGGRITDMVINVKIIHRTTQPTPSPRARHGAWLPCGAAAPEEKPSPVSSTGRR